MGWLLHNAALSARERASLSASLGARIAAANRNARANLDRVEAETEVRRQARLREEMHESWIEFKKANPDALSADEFRNCMAQSRRLEQMDEQIQQMDARMESKSSVIEMLESMYRAGESMSRGGMESTRADINEAVREHNAIHKERDKEAARYNSLVRRTESDCDSRRAPKSMIEALCADGRDNAYCLAWSSH